MRSESIRMLRNSTRAQSMACRPSSLRPTTNCLARTLNASGLNLEERLTALPPTYPRAPPSPFLMTISSQPSSRSLRSAPTKVWTFSSLSAGALRFADAARKVPQTRRVKHYGLPDEEINVEIDGVALSTLGLSIDDVQERSPRRRANTCGKLTAPNNSLTIEVAGDFDSAQSVRETFVKSDRDSLTGIRISDIASVTKSEASPPSRLALLMGDVRSSSQ